MKLITVEAFAAAAAIVAFAVALPAVAAKNSCEDAAKAVRNAATRDARAAYYADLQACGQNNPVCKSAAKEIYVDERTTIQADYIDAIDSCKE